MKPFWRSFWASIVAMVSLGLLVILIFVIVVSVAFQEEPYEVKENSILHLKLDEVISERSFASLNTGSFSVDQAMGIREIKMALEAAKLDDNIEGIYINTSNVNLGMASLEEVRDAVEDFKTSTKFVIAYAENYTQKTYYLSTVADEMYLFPEGMLDFRGLGAELMFFKGMIDKLGVDVQIIRGSNNKFKSAVEPFMLDSMSDANRKQTMTYLNALWGHMLDGISEKRGIEVAKLNEIADSVYVRTAEAAVEYDLIDALKYEDEVLNLLANKSNTEDVDEIELVDFSKYAYENAKKQDGKVFDKDKNIAVVYAVGGIESGRGGETTIGSDRIAGAIRDARLNENIKAIVLRVNSPGGSALASDVIWREMVLSKEQGKKVVVSMGDVAASGGYYISCAADRIFAQPNTITGSIGVFGVIPNFGPMLEEKVGITTSIVETNEHSVSLSVLNGLEEDERLMIQQGVDDIYDDFTSKVANGRGMTQADVDSIGQGRVWAGTDALEIGLVDELGGIDDAINHAAELANIKESDVKIKVLPERDNQLMDILMQFQMGGQGDEESEIMSLMKTTAKTVENISSMKGVQMRLPYEITIK